jgi:hypothetical protein
MPDNSDEINLANVNGEHAVAIAIITPESGNQGNRYDYRAQLAIRGVVLDSTEKTVIGRRFVLYVAIDSTENSSLRQFLNAAFNGGDNNTNSVCLDLEVWCSLEPTFRRFAFGVRVNFSKADFFKIEGTAEANLIRGRGMQLPRALPAPASSSSASSEKEGDSSWLDFGRRLDLDDGEKK